MTLASRSIVRIGAMAAVVLGIARPPVALASRPATTVGVAHLAHVLGPARQEIGAGRYVNGGGRGGRGQLAARHDVPSPPTTRSAGRHDDGCVLAGVADGRRRTSQSRTTSPVAMAGRLRPVRIVDIGHDSRATAPAALFHDAHAPPSAPVTDVAGLLA
jgi:hypothetical protein